MAIRQISAIPNKEETTLNCFDSFNQFLCSLLLKVGPSWSHDNPEDHILHPAPVFPNFLPISIPPPALFPSWSNFIGKPKQPFITVPASFKIKFCPHVPYPLHP